MTNREFYSDIRRHGEPIYGSREASQIAHIIMDELLGVDRMELLRSPDAEAPLSDERCREIVREVGEGRPVQYIVGEADFCDFRLVVREGCLIPRPESEELVRWVTAHNQEANLNVLDIGTGSGALAIALRRALPNSRVTALDLSTEALDIARHNAERLAADINFVHGDALHGAEHYVDGEFNVIISNPPYIPRSEADAMRCNVTHYEPHMALFVSDDDPLLFYRSIARSALLLLADGGSLYFEIHESYADDMESMLRAEGYGSVELRLDINDKPRMICARRAPSRH